MCLKRRFLPLHIAKRMGEEASAVNCTEKLHFGACFFFFFFFFYTFLPNFVIGLSETGTNAYGRTLRNTYARVRNPVYYGYMCRERT